MYLYWDFTKKSLKSISPKQKEDFICRLQNELKIPVGVVSGFDKPYILIFSTDPIQHHIMFNDKMIPRAKYITHIEVRHLTEQSDDFVEKIRKIAKETFS